MQCNIICVTLLLCVMTSAKAVMFKVTTWTQWSTGPCRAGFIFASFAVATYMQHAQYVTTSYNWIIGAISFFLLLLRG